MRRAGLSALLIVCLVTFLCPEVAKPNVITVTKAPDCCSKVSGCKMTHEQTSHHNRCRHESQTSSCCTVFVLDAGSFLPDLRRVLYSAFQRPHFCNRRRNRIYANGTASTPPPRINFSHGVRLGAKHARAALRVYAAEDSRNLNRRES